MSIMTQPPEWLAEGSEPPANKKQIGWEVDERPPAGWLNWLFNRIYQSLVELSSAITSHRSNTGNPHNVTPEQIGAETPTGAAAKANAAYSAAVDYANGLAAGLGDGLSQHVQAAAPHSGHATTTALNSHVNNKSNPHGVTAAQIGAETPSGAQAKVDSHANATSVHGATSSPTASRLVIRDANGRAQFADPVNAQDAATKAWVEGNCYLQSQWGKSVATFGYIRFPNGIILQWGMSLSGSSDSVSVTFPIAFPNICLGVVTSKVSGSTYEAITTDHSKTGMTVVNNPGGTDVGRARYFAIGY